MIPEKQIKKSIFETLVKKNPNTIATIASKLNIKELLLVQDLNTIENIRHFVNKKIINE